VSFFSFFFFFSVRSLATALEGYDQKGLEFPDQGEKKQQTRCSFCDESKLLASANDETTEDPVALDFFVFVFFSTDDRAYEIVCVVANHTQSIYSPLNLYQTPQQRLPELRD